MINEILAAAAGFLFGLFITFVLYFSSLDED